jgi:hypothetical protein
MVVDCAAAPLEPSQETGSHVAGQLEPYRATCLLLDDNRTRAYSRPSDQIANLDLDQVAAAQLAVYCHIEKSTLTKATFAIEEEADRPDLLCVKGRLMPTVFPAFQAARP